MIRKKILATAVGGVLIGGMLLSGGVALADESSGAQTPGLAGKIPVLGQMMKHWGGKAPGAGRFEARGPKLTQETLSQLVTDGVITQEKADEITAFISKEDQGTSQGTSQGTEQGLKVHFRTDLLSQMVTNNILTQEQADNIKTKLREDAQKQQQQHQSDILQGLVQKGTITQEQSDKILAQLTAAEKDRQAEMEKIRSMTPEERRQYMQTDKEKPQNPISQLVTDGVISQDQATAIGQVMPFNRGGRGVRY